MSRTDKLAVRFLMAVKITCCLYVLAPLAPRKGPVIKAPNAFAAMRCEYQLRGNRRS